MTARYVNVRKEQTSKSFHKNLMDLVKRINSKGIGARLTEHKYNKLVETGTIEVSGDYDFILDVLSPITRSGYTITKDEIVRGEQKC